MGWRWGGDGVEVERRWGGGGVEVGWRWGGGGVEVGRRWGGGGAEVGWRWGGGGVEVGRRWGGDGAEMGWRWDGWMDGWMHCACSGALHRLPRALCFLSVSPRHIAFPVPPFPDTRTGACTERSHSFILPCIHVLAPCLCMCTAFVRVLTIATLYPFPSPGCPMVWGPTFLLADIGGVVWLLPCHLQDSGVRSSAHGQSPVAPHGPILSPGPPRLGI